MKKYIIVFLLIVLTCKLNAQIKIADDSQKDNMPDLALLVSYMQGSFSSEEQSKTDTSYFDIRLQMKPMWTIRSNAHWIYVEQAVASKMDKPYRQRVYRVSQLPDGSFESKVFTFSEPLKYAGEWKKDNPLEELSPSDLTERKGCSVFLVKNDDGSFSGGTKGKGCESDLRNAKYASSEVIINKDGMKSWDRGFNENEEQVWGATKGGYIFRKVNN
ncbi:MAG: chromophore lyase CpcT/CpeT [Ignavibacteriae bacterium]|nr:chromophore lyase CpcT/CpeT [Ignavibacteriota bacterium]